MPVAVSGTLRNKDGVWEGGYPVVIRFYPVVSVCKRLKKLNGACCALIDLRRHRAGFSKSCPAPPIRILESLA